MTVGWGFIGAGYVASRAMAPAVHAAPNARLRAVASRDSIRSAELSPDIVHDAYQDILQDPRVDVVYINLTNVQHKQWVLAALNAGKHVVCEKPLAMNAVEVAEMMLAAHTNQRLLIEAVWTRWQPRMQRMAQVVRRGDLGEIVTINSAFTFQGDLTNNYRSRPEMGGGALLDVGCYQAHLWLMLVDEEVDIEIDAADRKIGSSGVDLTTRIQARLNRDIEATALCSFNMANSQKIEVTGTLASMSTGDGEAFTLWKQPSTLAVGKTIETFESDDAFMLMVQDISSQVLDGSPQLFPLSSSLHVAEFLDSARQFPDHGSL